MSENLGRRKRNVAGFAASTNAQQARALGTAMAIKIAAERQRTRKHLIALWVAIVVVAVLAVVA